MKLFLLSILLSSIHLIAFSQSTALDVTFGNNGTVITPIDSSSVIHGIAVQSDGKIVVAGSSSNGSTTQFAIARYNINGSLDTTFDSDGKAATEMGSESRAFAVALQIDGKIVAGGYMYNDSTWEFAIVRYKPDGTLDSSFGNNGKVHTQINNIDDEINAIAIQSDGKIIAVGYSNVSGDINIYAPALALVRYNNDGSLDSTFNNNGITTTSLGNYDVAYSVAIQNDGKIIIAGTHIDTSNYEFLLARYNINGTLDNSFNGNGKVITDVGNYYDVIHSVTIQNDGKIVVAGTSANGTDYNNYDFALARYNTDGSLDITFDGDGKVKTPLASYSDISASVGIESNGKIVVTGGISSNGTNQNIALVKYNDDGSVDSDGKTITNISGNGIINTMKVFGSKVYVGGSSDQFLVAAYENVSTLPVNLLSFNAVLQNLTTKLNWQTTGENNSRFKIERSIDGRNFSYIGEVAFLANNAMQKNYSFIDTKPYQGTNFYRLTLLEANGSFTYSKIIAVKFTQNNVAVNIFPNPATDIIHLRIPSSQKENITIEITDANGKNLLREVIMSTGTTISTSLNVVALKKGNYFVSINSPARSQVHKFIKQ